MRGIVVEITFKGTTSRFVPEDEVTFNEDGSVDDMWLTAYVLEHDADLAQEVDELLLDDFTVKLGSVIGQPPRFVAGVW